MAKPIFIIKIPQSPGFTPDYEGTTAKIQSTYPELYKDYHVLVCFIESIDELNFQMFSDKEIEPIELEKLKEVLNLKADESKCIDGRYSN